MSNEENNKDEVIEELAEKMAEGLEEEPAVEKVEVKESPVAEEPESEAESEAEPESEPEVKPATEEKPIAEEMQVEEVTLPEEPKVEEPINKKPSKKTIIALISAISVLVVLVAAYFFVADYYKDKFFMKTSVNGIDCSEMTMKEVETALQKKVEEYSLTIIKIDGTKETIQGTDIDIKYIGYNQIKEAFAEQKPFQWAKGFFKEKNIEAAIVFEYNKEKLEACMNQLECMKAEGQTAPVAATVIYKDGAFVIQNETYGTQIDAEKLKQVLHGAVEAINKEVSINGSGCYVQPKFTKDSKEVISAKDAMNEYLNASITYHYESIETTLTRDSFADWIYVDENMTPGVSLDKAKSYAKTLGSKYNTANRPGNITSPTGKVVTMPNASLGRLVGTDQEAAQIVQDIKSGKEVERSPIFSRHAMAEGQYMWGNTYIEVDITAQHMWFVSNGTIVMETPVVTGLKGKNDTPTGTYNILELKRNKTLVGRIVNGKPLYRTPVSYWMRVTWSGIGFHDANWQPTFGGSRYLTNGSHGCINMPRAKAGELYKMIGVGTPVVIHY